MYYTIAINADILYELAGKLLKEVYYGIFYAINGISDPVFYWPNFDWVCAIHGQK
jgi:hypothetical protein